MGELGEFAGPVESEVERLTGGGKAMDQADLVGFFGRDRFGAEHQIHRVALADERDQTAEAAPAGAQPHAGLDKADFGAVVHDAQIGGRDDFRAAAEGVAIYGGDDGARELAQLFKRVAHDLVELFAGRLVGQELSNVPTRDKDAVAGAGENQYGRWGLGDLADGRGKPLLGFPIEGVTGFRPVDTEEADVVL